MTSSVCCTTTSNGRGKYARVGAACLLLLGASTLCAQKSNTPAPQGQPISAEEARNYFQKAVDLTDLRAEGSPAFHMKVNFTALPGSDFTGEGTYEETWISKDKWRRDIALGKYHESAAVIAGKRTFQASESYRPTRLGLLE